MYYAANMAQLKLWKGRGQRDKYKLNKILQSSYLNITFIGEEVTIIVRDG